MASELQAANSNEYHGRHSAAAANTTAEIRKHRGSNKFPCYSNRKFRPNGPRRAKCILDTTLGNYPKRRLKGGRTNGPGREGNQSQDSYDDVIFVGFEKEKQKKK
jgi:hypothetical protein